MTPEQYWHDDPWLYCAYREAEAIRDDRAAWERWSMGAYVYQAIGDLIPVLNPFAKKHKPEKYMDRPFEIAAREEREKTPEELEQEAHERTKAWMLSFRVDGDK